MARIELLHITKRYGDVVALDDVSLTVDDNEFFCIFGPPTSGKTTLLRILLGLEMPDAGEVRIDGRNVTQASPASRRLAMVFQNLALFPHLNARENLRFPLQRAGLAEAQIAARIDAVAAKLHIAHLLHKLPAQLSGGERQRVAIGRALVRDPHAYLMDDPISALDARLREEMRVELKRLQRELGKTLIYVTHDQEEAMSVADRMAILEDGKVRQVAAPRTLYRTPDNRFVARLLGQPAMNFVAGRMEAGGNFAADDGGWRVAAPKVGDAEAIEFAFRPESARVVDPASAETGALRAQVFECEPLGAQTIVTVRTGRQLVKLALQGQHRYVPDEPIAFEVPPAERLFFDAAGGQRLAVH
jgi:multiple sugar transport system ATP-binding protein